MSDQSEDHYPIVYGPVQEGERTISDGTYPMSGWGWSCTCGQSGFGYATQAEAEDFCEAHNGVVSAASEALGHQYDLGLVASFSVSPVDGDPHHVGLRVEMTDGRSAYALADRVWFDGSSLRWHLGTPVPHSGQP